MAEGHGHPLVQKKRRKEKEEKKKGPEQAVGGWKLSQTNSH
jgi:hypothetical protein